MKAQQLIPVLQVIESGLFPVLVQHGRAQTADELSPLHASPSSTPDIAPISPHLQRLLARRAEAGRARANAAASGMAASGLRPGQIRWVHSESDGWPVALLIASVEGERAQGWIIASEALYASHEDWLLQDDDMDAPPDPRCAMVQLWNGVELSSTQLGERVGQLSGPAFARLSQVAAQLDSPPASLLATAPQPGRFGMYDGGGVAYVCGTPLGARDSGDPRLHYRYLYLRFSQQLQRQRHGGTATAARLPTPVQALEAANMPFWRLPGTWRGAGLAAALLLAVVLPLRLWQPDAPSEVRGAGTQASNFGMPARFRVMDVHFSATATLPGITTLLRQAQGRIISGPTETGAYRIAIDRDQAEAARDLLAASPLVVTLEKATP